MMNLASSLPENQRGKFVFSFLSVHGELWFNHEARCATPKSTHAAAMHHDWPMLLVTLQCTLSSTAVLRPHCLTTLLSIAQTAASGESLPKFVHLDTP